MLTFKDHSDFSFSVRTVLIPIAIISSLLLLYWGRLLFIPLFLAFLTAIFLYPLTRFFEKKHFSKITSAATSVLLFFLVIGILLYFFSAQLLQFLKALPDLKLKLDALAERVQTWMWENYRINSSPEINYIHSPLSIVSVAGNTIPIILKWLIVFALFLFFTFYILYHRRLLENFILSFFRESHRKKMGEIAFELRLVINGYVKGLMMEMLIFITSSLILLLVLGIKYALLMAVFAGVLNVIPYLGIYAATAINALVTFTATNLTEGLEVAAVFILIHIIDANIILPRIVGGSVKMNPFVTLIAVVVGHLIWGVPGMFLFIPLTAILRVLSEK
ncbi:MAG: AI-2E family transporter, partial [Bacteroidetes bacterium]